MPMSLGLSGTSGLALTGGGYSSAVASPTWMIAGSRGELATGTGGVSNSGVARVQGRSKHFLGQATYSKLKFVYSNYSVPTTSIETSPGFAKTINVAVEIPGAPIEVVRVLWSGADSVVLADGIAWQESDDILPASFGLASFAAGTVFWIRYLGDSVPGDTRVINNTTGTGTPAGEASYTSATSGTNTDQLMNSGALNPTSITAATQLHLPRAILGYSAAHGKSAVIGGMSIDFGQGEGTIGQTEGSAGGGHWRRALYAAGIPWASIARPGTTLNEYLANDTKRSLIYPYATHFVCGHATNDINGLSRTATQVAADIVLYVADIKAARPTAYIVWSNCIQRTTNANLTVPASQVPLTAFANSYSGGMKDFNTTNLPALLGSTVSQIVDLNTFHGDTTNTDRHRVIAGPTATVGDGVHPTAAEYTAWASGPTQDAIAAW